MTSPACEVSVVMATHDRPDRLRDQLASLRTQTLDPRRYEVIVVDDASGPETRTVLDEAAAAPGGPQLRLLRNDVARGPAMARNAGWRVARAALVAFTDDDCEAAPQWLEAGLRAWQARPEAFVQGPTRPIADEWHEFGPWSHTMTVSTLGPGFETCNIFYPVALLEQLGGFDEESYSMAGGEDTDLGWKAVTQGAVPTWAEDAIMYHAVVHMGPLKRLRRAWHWHESMLPFKRYPELRKYRKGLVFWTVAHYGLFRTLVALGLPRRLWWLRWWLAAPYVTRLTNRRSGPLLVPYFVIEDVVEIGACVRGSIRYRTVVL